GGPVVIMYRMQRVLGGMTAVWIGLLSVGFSASSTSAQTIPPEKGRRLEVLFLGSTNLFNHDPLTRFRTIRRALGVKGVNFTYTEDLADLNRTHLKQYDALLIFANHYKIQPGQGEALLNFVREGGGCVLLHCASACF